MNDKKKEHDESQEEGFPGKRPYETPRLTKLGTVEQLTQGDILLLEPDIVGNSI